MLGYIQIIAFINTHSLLHYNVDSLEIASRHSSLLRDSRKINNNNDNNFYFQFVKILIIEYHKVEMIVWDIF